MATTSPSMPLLFSVLTASHDNNEDFVNQLRHRLNQIEVNVQQTLNQLQQRKPYTSLKTTTNHVDSTIRSNFFDVLRDLATKNNLPFDESLFRRQILHEQESSKSLKVDIIRAKPSLKNETNDQHLSPVNNARRSQFAPVLSSTPVHQTSPVTPIPIDLTMATPSVAPVLTMNTTNLPIALPSAIVPQRAKVARTGGRPPRIPRDASVTHSKNNTLTLKEQQEEIVVSKEIHITSKREINGNEEIIEDHVEVVIERTNEILPNIIKQVQTTPLRGKAKKTIQENINFNSQASVPYSLAETETIQKKTRGGRTKKKDDEKVQQEVKPTRAASVRNRNKKEQEVTVTPQEEIPKPEKKTTRGKKTETIPKEDVILSKEENLLPAKRTTKTKKEQDVPQASKRITRNKKEDTNITKDEIAQPLKKTSKKKENATSAKEEILQPSKKTTRNKKLVEPSAKVEEKLSPIKVRATPSRNKSKPSLAMTEPIIPATPKKTITKSNKRKAIDDTNPVDTVQPSSPKRRAGRNTRSKISTITESTIISPVVIDLEPELQQQKIMPARSSRRGKKEIEIPIEKTEEIVLNKVTRTGRGKKHNESIKTDNPITVVDVVMTSVTASVPVPSSSSLLTKTLVSKPPRPPVARKKQSIAMPLLAQTSPTTPPSTTAQRIQATSPINDKPLLRIPIPMNGGRRRQPVQHEMITTPPRIEKPILETLPSNSRNLKRTRSSVVSTPKRVRRDDLIITVPSTPGRKRNACTCQKRRNKICDICAAAIEN